MHKYTLFVLFLIVLVSGCATTHIKKLDRKFDDFTQSYYDNVVRDVQTHDATNRHLNSLNRKINDLNPKLSTIEKRLKTLSYRVKKLEATTIIIKKKTNVKKPPTIKKDKKSERSLFWGNDRSK